MLMVVCAATSALSHPNVRINGFELAARIIALHLPVDAALDTVHINGGGGDFVARNAQIADAAHQLASARRREHFVKRPGGVYVLRLSHTSAMRAQPA